MIRRRGQTLPLVAIALLVLLGAAAFAVDTGYHQYQQRMQQTAADSAALAGARELSMGDWFAAARQDAANNGFSDNTGQTTCPAGGAVGQVCVEVYNPPQAGDAYAGNPQAVEVDVTANHATFFEQLFGYNNVPVSTKAVAVLRQVPSNNCLYVLNGPANFNGQTGGGTVNAPNCGLMFNQAANFHGATVTAASIDCASTCSNGTFTSATPQPVAPASDPCPAINYCAHLANPAPTCTSTMAAPSFPTGGTAIVQPGCYGNLNLTRASTVTFQCGFYIFTGTVNASTSGPGTPIQINQDCGTTGPSGVTFYVTGVGSLNLRNDVINLAAPTSGDYNEYSAGEQNVLIYQTPGDTNTLNMQSASCAGCNSYFSGMIYAPSATLNYNQYTTTTTGQVLIIVGTLNANGGINTILTGPGGPPGTTVTVPVLGE